MIPLWTNDCLTAPRPFTLGWRNRAGASTRWTAPTIRYTTRAICKRCNSLWLGTWEGKLKPLLCPLIGGKARKLPPAELRQIAAWLFKTALLIPYCVPEPSPWPERYYAAFYDTNKTVPNEALIWLGAYEGGGDPVWAYANILTASRQNEPGTNREGHMVTFYVGNLLAKVQLIPDDDLGATQKRQVTGAMFRIWPQPDKPDGLLWPTIPYTLDDVRKEARSVTVP